MFEGELTTLNVPQPFSRYAPQTYDAVWAIGLALKGAEEFWRNESRQLRKKRVKLDRFDYTRFDMANEFLNQLSRLNFLGVSVSRNFHIFLPNFFIFERKNASQTNLSNIFLLIRVQFHLMEPIGSEHQLFTKYSKVIYNLLLYIILRLNI